MTTAKITKTTAKIFIIYSLWHHSYFNILHIFINNVIEYICNKLHTTILPSIKEVSVDWTTSSTIAEHSISQINIQNYHKNLTLLSLHPHS